MWTDATREKYEREAHRYASDLSDTEWCVIEPHMPPAQDGYAGSDERDPVHGPQRLPVAHAARRVSAAQLGSVLFLQVARRRDVAGGQPVDADVHINPETGLPYHLAGTPFELTSKTMRGSPDFNVKHHPLSGLLSSMHTAGLLNGRYGLAPPGILARFEGEKRAFAEQVLADELRRQEDLKPLADTPEDDVWRAYKQLQFFDMLSLYFHARGEGHRGEDTMPDVPTKDNGDVTITVQEQPGGRYTLDPFPFAEDGTQISFEGRWLAPSTSEAEGRAAFHDTSVTEQIVTLSVA